MNAVGIDISKGKSMVSVMRPLGEVVAKPFSVRHTGSELKELADYLKSLNGETRVIMEHTGRYYEPVAQFLHDAGLYVSAVNPKLIKDYGNNSLRKVKTDKADSRKIAKYGLDNWVELRQYASMDKIRYQLKTLNRQAIVSLNAASKTVEQMKAEMLQLVAQFPEYPVVMGMHSVGDSLGPQLMAEIGDMTRFARRSSITSFAGVDPGTDQSGGHEAKSVPTSKSGPPELRKALFLVMDNLLKSMPQDDPVYRFMDKKHAEGKPYLVYMTAGANKFLRTYYGKVKEYLAKPEQPSEPVSNERI